MSHAAPSAATVIRAFEGSMKVPAALPSSTLARKSSASFFVVNPRFVVCEWSGFRYRTR
jgi:hypothetical protein